jgi:hypothetical protein
MYIYSNPEARGQRINQQETGVHGTFGEEMNWKEEMCEKKETIERR